MDPAVLNPQQLASLVEASRRAKRVRRCATVATLGGWTTGSFGVISLLLLPLSFSWPGVLISLGLIAVAAGEFRGGAMVRRFDPRGASALAWNQGLLGLSLTVYAAWSLVLGLRAGVPASGLSGDPQADAMVADITRLVNIGVYGSLALVGIVMPGLTAWYYASRGRHIAAFRRSTDASVVEALKAA
jgi:hypothetical protein